MSRNKITEDDEGGEGKPKTTPEENNRCRTSKAQENGESMHDQTRNEKV
jgi:hypothetical protein